jgi:hypothetical protein
MALLKVEAEKLSNNDLQRGVIEEIVTLDDTFALLPFMRTNGKAYVHNRENTISEGTFLDPNATVTEGAATFTEVTTNLRILAGDVDVDKFLNETMSDTNDQLATQIALKAKALGRKWQATFINGDNGATAQEFDGLVSLVEAGQTIASTGTDGDALTLTKLDELADKIPYGPDAFIMNSAMIRQYRNLLRTVGGGTDANMLQLRNFDRPILTHNGIPILKNDFILSDEAKGTMTDGSSIYAVRMNEDDGVHGIFGGDSAGIRIENIGTVQNKDAWRVRVKWYSAIVMKSTLSLARASELTTS